MHHDLVSAPRHGGLDITLADLTQGGGLVVGPLQVHTSSSEALPTVSPCRASRSANAARTRAGARVVMVSVAPSSVTPAPSANARRSTGSVPPVIEMRVGASRLRTSAAGGSGVEHPAVVHDRDAVAERLGFVHVVGRQDHRPALGVDVA
jgi:hypothetical protein